MVPRSAVKVSASRKHELQRNMARVEELEKVLETYKKANPKADMTNQNEKLKEIRTPLCRALTEIFLSFPLVAFEEDVDRRLWEKCFYDVIKPLRSKLGRAKKKKTQNLAELQSYFTSFLNEAIHLYEFMHELLKAKLERKEDEFESEYESQSQQAHVDPSMMFGQSESQTQTYGSQHFELNSEPAPRLESLDGIVECLCHINIRCGDLYRYKEELDKSQKAYQLAANLGPGIGHVYNQLAVVCQTKEQQGSSPLSAVAVYWYARSLACMKPQFTSARKCSNLALVFDENTAWLKKSNSSAAPTHQSAIVAQPKPIQTKQFLAEWVDLHRVFFLQQASTTIYKQMEKTMDRFGSLLQVSAFGDALIAKLIAVQAFSEFNCKAGITDQSSQSQRGSSNSSRGSHITFYLAARTSTLQLGIRMADKVLASAVKQQQLGNTASNSKQPPSVRLLLPLLLVTEYLWTTEVDKELTKTRGKAPQRHNEAQQEFWERMVQVFNHVAKQFGLAVSDLPEIQPDDVFHEWKVFLGFSPFGGFCFWDSKDGFLTDEEAVAILNSPDQGSTGFTQTQQNTQSQSQQQPQDKGHAHALLAQRFLFVASHVADLHPHITCNKKQQRKAQKWLWEWHETAGEKDSKPDEPMQEEEEDDDDDDATTDDVQDQPMLPPENDDDNQENHQQNSPPDGKLKDSEKEKETLVYQEGFQGGPALLVPGALLASVPHSAQVAAVAATNSEKMEEEPLPDVEMDHIVGGAGDKKAQAASQEMPAGPTPGLKPPPGFGSGNATVQAPLLPAAQPAAAAPVGFVLPPQNSFANEGYPGLNELANSLTQSNTLPSGQSTAFGSPGIQSSFLGQGGSSIMMGPTEPTIADVLNGSGTSIMPPTNNPFVSPAPAAAGPIVSGTQQPNPLAFLETGQELGQGNHNGSEEVSLLDSGLLQSLWMDDTKPKTKNPFAY